MTNKEAIEWLSPVTSPFVIGKYREEHGEKAAMAKLNEAIDVACRALRTADIKRIK